MNEQYQRTHLLLSVYISLRRRMSSFNLRRNRASYFDLRNNMCYLNWWTCVTRNPRATTLMAKTLFTVSTLYMVAAWCFLNQHFAIRALAKFEICFQLLSYFFIRLAYALILKMPTGKTDNHFTLWTNNQRILFDFINNCFMSVYFSRAVFCFALNITNFMKYL